MPTRRRNAALLILALAAGMAATASRADTPDLGAGARIAATKCGRCHATNRTDESPARAAPPFRELAAEPIEMLEAARSSGVVSGHDEMPMFELTRAEVDDLIAYIHRLAGNPVGR